MTVPTVNKSAPTDVKTIDSTRDVEQRPDAKVNNGSTHYSDEGTRERPNAL